MAKRINVKLIMDLSAGGLTQNEIANSRHFSKTSVSLVLKTAKELEYTGIIRTPFRYYTDSVTVLSGFSSGIIRTAF